MKPTDDQQAAAVEAARQAFNSSVGDIASMTRDEAWAFAGIAIGAYWEALSKSMPP